jgi:hypothetical protein
MEDDIALRSLEESVAPSDSEPAAHANLVDRFQQSERQVVKKATPFSLASLAHNRLVIVAVVSAAFILALALYIRPPLVTKKAVGGEDERDQDELDLKRVAMWVVGGALVAVAVAKFWR